MKSNREVLDWLFETGRINLERAPLFGRLRELFSIAPGSWPALEKFLEPWNERLA